MEINSYLIFLITTIVVVFSPGPAAITVASQGASNGFLKSGFGVAGVASANVVYFVLSATGIAALIVASNTLFTFIKWCGVLYLIYLGLTAIFSKSGAISIKKSKKSSGQKLFASGFLVELANPKALLYFSALLPTFINPEQSVFLQIAIMGSSCLAVDLIVYSLYGYLGSALSRGSAKAWLVNIVNKLAGGFLLFASARMASVTVSE